MKLRLFAMVLVIAIAGFGCSIVPQHIDVQAVGKANVVSFLSGFENGYASQMGASSASTVTLVQKSGNLDDVATYSNKEFVSFWASQFSYWHPENMTATITSVGYVPSTEIQALILANVTYTRSDTQAAFSDNWTFTTDDQGKISKLRIE